MNIEKFYADVKEQLNLHEKYTRAARLAGENIITIKDIFAQELCEHYKEFVDKKVRITFEWEDNWSKKKKEKSVEGYLLGFDVKGTYSADGIFPRIAKIKKDGSPSLNYYSHYDIMAWNQIKSVEEIK